MTTTSTDRRSGAFLQAAIKLPCRVVAVADIPVLAGLLTIDGVTLAAGDRVLATAQSPNTENGIYVADTGEWTRSTDCNGSRDLVQGTIVAVVAGAAYAGSVWQVTTASPVVGSALAWSRMGASALALVSAFMLTVLDDVDAATARATLGVPSLAATTALIDAAGDLLYGSANDTLAKLGIGSTGQQLTVVGGLPAWASGLRIVRTQIITVSGTYTPDPNLVYAIIEGVGGGGAGGSVLNATAISNGAGGGGSGGYSRAVKTAAQIGASQTVTIGAAGAAAAAGNNNGGAGGDTSVGALVIAKGGSGGIATNGSTSAGAGGAGGVAGTGDFTPVGNQGGQGNYIALASGLVVSGYGGPSHFGGGVCGMWSAAAAVAGTAGKNYGAGGAGGYGFNGAQAAGGNGAAGVVFITEFCKA